MNTSRHYSDGCFHFTIGLHWNITDAAVARNGTGTGGSLELYEHQYYFGNDNAASVFRERTLDLLKIRRQLLL
jgi:hypothetical protein